MHWLPILPPGQLVPFACSHCLGLPMNPRLGNTESPQHSVTLIHRLDPFLVTRWWIVDVDCCVHKMCRWRKSWCSCILRRGSRGVQEEMHEGSHWGLQSRSLNSLWVAFIYLHLRISHIHLLSCSSASLHMVDTSLVDLSWYDSTSAMDGMEGRLPVMWLFSSA